MAATPAPNDYETELIALGYRLIAGVDEAGRGALAGPVVAAAVIFPVARALPCVADSKTLAPAQREALEAEIRGCAVAWAVGVVSVEEIEAINILRATHVAMREALRGLSPAAEFVLVDGLPVPDLPAPARNIIEGDKHCCSIAAASILAKVHRDRLMCELDVLHPGYGFAAHKGYGTTQHQEALERLGACSAHRMTFGPVRALGQGRLGLQG